MWFGSQVWGNLRKPWCVLLEKFNTPLCHFLGEKGIVLVGKCVEQISFGIQLGNPKWHVTLS